MNPAPPRLESLQAYRAVAAISVVLLHIGGKFAAVNYYSAKAPNGFEWGKIGVDFFFVLSGFIIAQSMQRSHQHSGNFLLHRALRIYPPFWLAFFVTLPVALLLAGRLNSPVTTHPWSLAWGAMLLPQSIDPPVIGVAWTLHHELLFYLLAGLFLSWPRTVLSAASVLLLFSVVGVAGFPWDSLTSPLNWEFVMGVGASFLLPQMSSRIGQRMAIVSALALLCLVITVPGNLNEGLERVRVWVFAPLFALLIAGSARWEMGAEAPASLPSRLLARLGASSYTLYLWHVSLVTPLTKLCFSAFPLAGAPVVLLFTLGIALLAVAVAHLIYLHVEQPLVKLQVRRLARRPLTSAA